MMGTVFKINLAIEILHNVFVYIILWRIAPWRVHHTSVVPGKILEAPDYVRHVFTGPAYRGLQIIRYNSFGDAHIKM